MEGEPNEVVRALRASAVPMRPRPGASIRKAKRCAIKHRIVTVTAEKRFDGDRPDEAGEAQAENVHHVQIQAALFALQPLSRLCYQGRIQTVSPMWSLLRAEGVCRPQGEVPRLPPQRQRRLGVGAAHRRLAGAGQASLSDNTCVCKHILGLVI